MIQANQSAEIADLSAAFAVAQGAMQAAAFNRTNSHYKNKYADLAAVWDAIREPLSKSGLSITQTTQMIGESLMLVTTMRHASGQWVESHYPLPMPTTMRPHEFGAFYTYARRYSLTAMTGTTAEEDSDGMTAGEKPKPIVDMSPISDEQRRELILEIGEDHTLSGLIENKYFKELDCQLDTFPVSQLGALKNSIAKYKRNLKAGK